LSESSKDQSPAVKKTEVKRPENTKVTEAKELTPKITSKEKSPQQPTGPPATKPTTTVLKDVKSEKPTIKTTQNQAPEPIKEKSDKTIAVKKGDTLWKYFGIKWQEAYKTNPQIHGRPGEKIGPQYPDTKQIVIIYPREKIQSVGIEKAVKPVTPQEKQPQVEPKKPEVQAQEEALKKAQEVKAQEEARKQAEKARLEEQKAKEQKAKKETAEKADKIRLEKERLEKETKIANLTTQLNKALQEKNIANIQKLIPQLTALGINTTEAEQQLQVLVEAKEATEKEQAVDDALKHIKNEKTTIQKLKDFLTHKDSRVTGVARQELTRVEEALEAINRVTNPDELDKFFEDRNSEVRKAATNQLWKLNLLYEQKARKDREYSTKTPRIIKEEPGQPKAGVKAPDSNSLLKWESARQAAIREKITGLREKFNELKGKPLTPETIDKMQRIISDIEELKGNA
jgi:hypothetical protein